MMFGRLGKRFDDWLWSLSVAWQRVVIALVLVAVSFSLTGLVMFMVYVSVNS